MLPRTVGAVKQARRQIITLSNMHAVPGIPLSPEFPEPLRTGTLRINHEFFDFRIRAMTSEHRIINKAPTVEYFNILKIANSLKHIPTAIYNTSNAINIIILTFIL